MNMISEVQEEKKVGGEVALKHEVITGLSDGEVLENRKRHGENRLPVQKDTSAWIILLSQFKSPLIYIILAAAFISLVAGEPLLIIFAWLGGAQLFRSYKLHRQTKRKRDPSMEQAELRQVTEEKKDTSR